MGMNPDTGEIRQFPNPEAIPEGWVPLDNREARRLLRVPAPDRLRELDRQRVRQATDKFAAKKARRHAAALSRAKNRR